MFRGNASKLKFMPENGMRVIVHGSVSVYSQGGSYQLYVGSMQPDGIGALYLAYEQLKARLAEEGLFDPETKKPIPRYPRRIGVITSPTGAAVRDIINVLGRRYPIADIYLYPALVQGDGAEESLCKALQYLNDSKLVDVVIIGRGGGSIEDLWAFNSEKLARLIYSATVPIISAVGHETDFTICDFVADLRAPTPSAAAELSAPDIRDITISVDSYSERLDLGLRTALERGRARLDALMARDVLRSFNVTADLREAVDGLKKRLDDSVCQTLSDLEKKMGIAVGKLEVLNPLSVLRRGYSMVEFNDRIITKTADLKPDDLIKVRMSDGSVYASVKRTDLEI